MDLKQYIRTIPDFPEEGIMFRDVTTLFNNSEAFNHMVNSFAEYWNKKSVTTIAGIDARGFIIGGALAYKMRKPFVALRKKGNYRLKLSVKTTISSTVQLLLRSTRMRLHTMTMF